jgi:hypothetical protein
VVADASGRGEVILTHHLTHRLTDCSTYCPLGTVRGSRRQRARRGDPEGRALYGAGPGLPAGPAIH